LPFRSSRRQPSLSPKTRHAFAWLSTVSSE
jgi:hypothetical protein